MTTLRDVSSTATAGYLSELFCSVQGEGLFIGERQLFLRTAGCVATCSWCDTVYSKVRTPRFVVHNAESDATWRPNPVSTADAVADVLALAKVNEPVRTVSLTGGEPLEQPEFAGALAAALRAQGLRIHLETAGLHAAALASLLDHIDVIAMDVKLPSATGVAHWDAHRAFLGVLKGTSLDPARNPVPALFVKVIVDLKADVNEIEQAATLVSAAGRSIPFVLQPESGIMLSRKSTRPERTALLKLIDDGARAAMRHLDTVRVIPQTHKVLHVR